MPFEYVTEYAVLFVILCEPVSLAVPSGIVIHVSSVGGVRVEYATALLPFPTATHVPLPYAILNTCPPSTLLDNIIVTQLS